MGAITEAILTILDPDHGIGRLSEEWARIPDRPRYWVSDEGRVYSEHSGKILTPYTNTSDTYLVVDLYRDGVRWQRLVHQLVAGAFLDEDRDGRQVNHKDGDPLNNCVENLEWVEEENHATEAQKRAREEDSALSQKDSAPF